MVKLSPVEFFAVLFLVVMMVIPDWVIFIILVEVGSAVWSLVNKTYRRLRYAKKS